MMNSEKTSILERHDRSIRIIGEKRQERLAKSTIVVAGIGAVGTPLLEIMVRQGVETIIVIDPDPKVEEHNLDRQFLFRESSVGRPKVLAAKSACIEINSNVEVIPYIGTFSQAVNSFLITDLEPADLIFSGIDNRLGRYSVAKFAFTHDIPHLDGATGGFNCRGYIFPNPRKGPCLLCTFSKKDYEEISKPYSCTRRTRNSIAGAITETGVIVATILAMEAVKLLTGIPLYYNEIRLNLENWKPTTEKIDPTENHRYFHII